MKNRNVLLTSILIAAAAIALIAFIVLASIMPAIARGAKPVESHKLEIDYSLPEGEMAYGASGWLYGMSEDGIPSGDLLSPLSPAVAVAKAPDGEQHPVGDVQSVGGYFLESGGDYLIVYLQDIFPDWYYIYEGYEDYAAKVTVMVNKILALPYGDKIACCPFNECDNGAWYGKFSRKYNRFAFYKAWHDIYNLIKDISPDTKIAGPGYMEYKHDYVAEFMEYCKANDCLPEIIIWHELSERSYYEYQENYKDYRALEKSLGLNETEICISEYGQPSDNGVPGKMIQYISDFESTKVTACLAFWRLADNFSELAADVNTPTPAWWLYYRYGQMQGMSYKVVNPERKASHFRAVTSYDEADSTLTLLCGGDNGSAEIALDNLGSLAGFEDISTLYATIEYVEYEGLGGECLAPTRYACLPLSVSGGNATLKLENVRADRAYFITIGKEEAVDFPIDLFATRYEAEAGSLIGLTNAERSRAVPKPNYAVSGKFVFLPSGEGQSLDITVNAPESGDYILKLCYANGSKTDNNRTDSHAYMTVDGGEKIDIAFPNTLSYTTTGNLSISVALDEGEHKLSFGCTSGKVSFDFIDLIAANSAPVYLARLNKDGRYMIVVGKSGHYAINADASAEITFQGETHIGSNVLYLARGVNLLPVTGGKIYNATAVESEALPADISLNGDFGDRLSVRGKDKYISLIVNAPASGVYAMSIPYANDSEFGIHDYNVKLVERYAVVEVNGVASGAIFFRNTYSLSTYSNRIVYITLAAGANTVKIYNDNSYHPDTACAYLPLIAEEDIAIYSLNA